MQSALQTPVGVFGGTFDPIHIGHLRSALEVQELLALAQMRLIPSQIPPHRDLPELSAADRLELLRRAVDGCPGFVVDTREVEREGPSYMVDTLKSLRADFPRAPLCLILGMDAFCKLPGWHRWSELSDLAHVVVLHRPGSDPTVRGELAEWLAPRRVDDAQGLRTTLAGRVMFLQVTQLDISATRIRELLAAGRSARFLVPEAVWTMISQRGLYGYASSDRNTPMPGGQVKRQVIDD